MESPFVVLPVEFIEMRLEHIKAHGPMTLDALVCRHVCTKCNESVGAGWGFGTNASCGFKSLSEFQSLAGELTQQMAGGSEQSCCQACGGRTQVFSVQYHAYHSGLDRDLVLMWKPEKGLISRPTLELLKWDPAGPMLPAGELTPGEEARFVRDAALREAWAAFEIGDVQNAIACVEGLCTAYPDEPLLVRFVPAMIARGYAKLSKAIADHHVKVRPDDAEGYYWSGEVLLQCVNHGIEPVERLQEVRTQLERAVAARPDHLPATLSLCNVLRAERRFDEARAAFEKLLATHPDCGEAHYNLGGMALDDDPQTALIHFGEGERLCPDDPDYPVGCARAHIRLGRRDDAISALERARRLTDSHPRFAEVEAALSRRFF